MTNPKMKNLPAHLMPHRITHVRNLVRLLQREGREVTAESIDASIGPKCDGESASETARKLGLIE